MHYPEELRLFFISVGVRKRAELMDYARTVQKIAAQGQTDEKAIERLRILYRRLWHAMQDGGDWQENDEWKEIREGRNWLGRKGNEFSFYTLKELVFNDHDYLAHLFSESLPFWAFDDLLELAKQLEITPCSSAQSEFEPIGKLKELSYWTGRVSELSRDIHRFLESHKWKSQCRSTASMDALEGVKVFLAEQLQVCYRLNGIDVPEQREASYLDVVHKRLWLPKADESDYPEFIGDALQEYFGVSELREFVKDLLKGDREKVLNRWQQRGLLMDEVPKPTLPIEPITEGPPAEAERLPAERRVKPTQVDSVSKPEDRQLPEPPDGLNGIGSREESDEHRMLKERLQQQPDLLEQGMRCIEVEYQFPSGDKIDLVMEDANATPVAIEVKPIGNKAGLWQAIKYKHLLAVERELPCDDMRAMLVAPQIPEDIKQECKRYGVEPKEVSFG